MNFTNTLTSNWENSFRGLRNPMNSWDKSDSKFGLCDRYHNENYDLDQVIQAYIKDKEKKYGEIAVDDYEGVKFEFKKHLLTDGIIRKNSDWVYEYAYIGPNDMDLAQRMINGGRPNDKFLRQIFVSVDITAPLYWWKEMDTYKVGTVANSTSTMHKLASTPITLDCFEMDDFNSIGRANLKTWEIIIDICEDLRLKYNETKDERYWKELIRILPESWLQTRTWSGNYDVLRNIYYWRKNHRLQEWHQFCDWCKTLPYAEQLILYKN